eukprot:567260-Rhodomonas_salina.1
MCSDADPCPNPDPETVALAEPVPAWLTGRTPVIRAESKENDAVCDPALRDVVTANTLLPDNPDTMLHIKVLSDFHVVASHTVPPDLTDAVYPDVAKLDPNTYRLEDPVAATFAESRVLADEISYEIVDETLPTWTPSVTTSLKLLKMPLLAMPGML